MTTTYSPEALEGIRIITAGEMTGGLGPFREPVKAAIEAGLAYDADPNYWASDMLIGRSAALTEEGLRVAHEGGFLTACACGEACKRETNPTVSAYCHSCRVRGNREGWINAEQCYGCYLTSHPDVFQARLAILKANETHNRRDRNDWQKRHRYEEGLNYIDPTHTRVKDYR